MTEVELFAEWKYPDEKPDDSGFGLSHKAERLAFIAGYKYHEANTPLPEDTVLFNKGVEEGKRLMMEEAVEAEYGYFSNASKTILPSEKLNIKEGDKVRVIVLKKED